MHFRENLKKSAPHFFSKKAAENKTKNNTNKNKNKNTTRKTQKNKNKHSKLRIVNQYTGTHKLLVTCKAQG